MRRERERKRERARDRERGGRRAQDEIRKVFPLFLSDFPISTRPRHPLFSFSLLFKRGKTLLFPFVPSFGSSTSPLGFGCEPAQGASSATGGVTEDKELDSRMLAEVFPLSSVHNHVHAPNPSLPLNSPMHINSSALALHDAWVSDLSYSQEVLGVGFDIDAALDGNEPVGLFADGPAHPRTQQVFLNENQVHACDRLREVETERGGEMETTWRRAELGKKARALSVSFFFPGAVERGEEKRNFRRRCFFASLSHFPFFFLSLPPQNPGPHGAGRRAALSVPGRVPPSSFACCSCSCFCSCCCSCFCFCSCCCCCCCCCRPSRKEEGA